MDEALRLRQNLDKAQLPLNQFGILRNLQQRSPSKGVLNNGKERALEGLFKHGSWKLKLLIIQVLLKYPQKAQYLFRLLLPLLLLTCNIPFLIGRTISSISNSFLLDQFGLIIIPRLRSLLLEGGNDILLLLLHLIHTATLDFLRYEMKSV